MFQDARKEPSLSESQFVEYLENVKQLRSGHVVHGHERNRWLKQVREKPSVAQNDRTIAVSLIGVTAINLLVGLFFLVRHLRKRALRDSGTT